VTLNLTGLRVNVSRCARVTSHLADVDGRHLRGADRRMTRGVWQRLARPDGQLLLLPGRHDLLGNCNTHDG